MATTRRKYKDKVYETHLLRRTYREGGKVKHQTLGNLSHLPAEFIELIRGWLRGEVAPTVLSAGVTILHSLAHGHVAAVLGSMRRLGVERLLGSRASRERSLVLAMIAARIIEARSKLATACSLNGEAASSTLAEFGHNRDGKNGYPQIVYGLLSSEEGCPVAVEVFPGSAGERLIVCRNPFLAAERARKREQLLAATEKQLEQIARATRRSRRAVRAYKDLSKVGQAFHCLKTVDSKIRPIGRSITTLSTACALNVFLCMLAYYAEWHMREWLKPLLFVEEEPDAAEELRAAVVAPAGRSAGLLARGRRSEASAAPKLFL